MQKSVKTAELNTQTAEPSLLDVSNCVANWFSAIGTVGAVIVSLFLAYRGSRRKLVPSTKVSFKTLPTKRLKTIEILLHNKSNYSVTVNELNLEFRYSTTSESYNETLALSNKIFETSERGKKQKTPTTDSIHIKPRAVHRLTLDCDNDEVGKSIATRSSGALLAHIRAMVIDEAGHSSHGKWTKIK